LWREGCSVIQLFRLPCRTCIYRPPFCLT
jgi:hypothetical protein